MSEAPTLSNDSCPRSTVFEMAEQVVLEDGQTDAPTLRTSFLFPQLHWRSLLFELLRDEAGR